MKILIVEDNEALRESLKDRLEDQFEVSVAENGESAKEILERERFDLLLTDLDIPPGPTGSDIILWLKKAGRAEKPILMSASDPNVVDALAGVIGAASISKPFGYPDLERAITKALSLPTAA